MGDNFKTQRRSAASKALPAEPGRASAETPNSSLEAMRRFAAGTVPAAQGAALPDRLRARFEDAFGQDLSAVRLYEHRAVADAGAQAVTRGSDIAFAPGMLDFSSADGRTLLGHELSHVVSQQRGEVRGSGFLNDSALEARADREGARAAAGQTVQAGPASAPLSAATAAPAAGPMQARKDGQVKGGYKGQRTLHLDGDPRSAEQLAHDRDIESRYETEDADEGELAQDTGWDMDSVIEKRGWLSRNVGKHFYRNSSKTNFLKNLGVGAALPFIMMGSLAKKGWKAMKRSNQDAVDQFNNFDADYRRMDKWDKFKSFASSPIAWMTAAFRHRGTDERNARRRKIADAAELWRNNNARFLNDTDTNFDALRQIPDVTQQRDAGGRAQKDPASMQNAALYGGSGGKFGTMGLKYYKGATGTAAARYDALSASLGTGGALLNAIASGVTANNQRKIGDKYGAAVAGLASAGYAGNALSGLAQTTLSAASAAGSSLASNPVLNAAVPGLGILSGTANLLSGATQAADATETRSGMTKSIGDLDKKGSLSRDQRRLRNTFEQVHDVAVGDQREGIVRTIGGGLEATGSAMTLSGLGALAGTIVGGAGTTLNVLAGKYGESKRADVGDAQMEKDAQFTKQVEVVRRRFKNLHLSTREARQVVMQSMGMLSGDRKEAVQNMTMKRAFETAKAANDPHDPNFKTARTGLIRMGLSPVNGRFSLQAVAQKLGFAKNKTWQEQLLKTKQQGVHFNPFAAKAQRVPQQQNILENAADAEAEAEAEAQALPERAATLGSVPAASSGSHPVPEPVPEAVSEAASEADADDDEVDLDRSFVEEKERRKSRA